MAPPLTPDPEQLVAAYARFAEAIAAIPAPQARELHRVASEVPRFVADALLREAPPTRSELALGLAQGLRELPELIADVDVAWRWAVSRALHEALVTHCPAFVVLEAQRVQGILARGDIETDVEFHLLRYRIDVLEGEPELTAELRDLRAMVQAYAEEADVRRLLAQVKPGSAGAT